MLFSRYRHQAAAILLAFSLHSFAIPTRKELVQLNDRDLNWCPVIDSTVSGVHGVGWTLPSIPAGHKIWIQTSGSLDDEDDDNTSFEAKDELRLKQRSPAEVANVALASESKRDFLSVRQAPLDLLRTQVSQNPTHTAVPS